MTAEDFLSMTVRPLCLAIVLVVGSAAAFPASLRAQQGEGPAPLSKADVIRLLTSDTYSESQIDRIVRRSCISFRLTERDRADFRELGASPSILEALEECSRSAPVTVTASPESLRATVGDTVPVTLVARRGDVPAEGIPLSVPEAIRSRGDGPPVVNTNSQGQAPFRIAAGREPSRRSLAVTSPEDRIDADLAIPFLVQPAGPAAVRVWPDTVTLRPGEDSTERVLVTVADRFGNGAPGVPVVARGDTAPSAEVVADTVTDSWGDAVLRVPGRSLAESEALGVWAGGERLARIEVRRPGSASAMSDVVAGADGDSAPATDSAAMGDSRAETDVAEEPGRGAGPGTMAAIRRDARDSPADASAWLELAEAWRDAARPLESRLALLQARSVASGTVRDSVDRALSEVYGTAPGLRVEALWGRTLQREAAAGPRFAEARLRATTFLEVWGRYDRSLPREVPGLLRGPDALDAYYGGAEVEWGPDSRAATVLEAGRREVEGRELAQNVVRIEQEVRFPTDRGHIRVQGGGVLGRWYDRDDWLAYVRGAVPVALSVDIRPSVSVGETVGTDLAARGRVPAREVRGGLGVEIRPAPGMRITPAFRYGVVEADAGEESDSLWEVELAASIPITAGTGLELVARRQSPPRSPEFTILAAGLRFAIH